MSEASIGIGLIGCGTVGSGVITLLGEMREAYAQRLGRSLELRRVLVRNTTTPRDAVVPANLMTDDPETFFGDPDIDIVVEVAGGLDPVGGFVERALAAGKHVVTANKSLLAARGVELFALARKHDVCIAFEASCGGGIPILQALKFGLAANRVDALYGILNGTCNYILSQMSDHGAEYDAALTDAKAKGFAEADPTLDVTGADAAQKLAILASLAFGVAVNADDVSCQGIDEIEIEDIHYGVELGYAIKLLAIAERQDEGYVLRVHPCFVHMDEPLSQVRDAFNAVSVFGHAVGHSMFYGHGAGQMPTASAVVSDILNVAAGWYPQAFKSMAIWPDQHEPSQMVDPDDVNNRYYLRIAARDVPGVMAKVAKIIGDLGISISAILQHESDEDSGFVPLIITTHDAREGSVRQAAEALAQSDVVAGRPACLRIIELPTG
ncbi:homoserine dehydrogenase [Planctomycetales bacterium ZRK34]|nr:homoserine dehydrogenase [Planctomycetales bacterium ZRK34]